MNVRFKTRISIYNTVAIAILIALVFMAVYWVVHATAYHQLDTGLEQESQVSIGNLMWKQDSIIINKMPEWQESEHTQVELNPIFLQVANIQGTIIFRTINLLNHSLPSKKNIVSPAYFNATLQGQHIRIGVFPIITETGRNIGTVTLGVSGEGTFLVLKNLRISLLLSFIILLVILYSVTSFAASGSIAPVHQLIKSASGIDDSNIETRMPLPPHKDEIYHLATTINELLDRVELSIRQQKQFTADASHELRTPLAAIRGLLEVLILRRHDIEYYETKIEEVIQQVDRLEHLIGQLMQLTKLESGTTVIRKEPIPLQQFVNRIKAKWDEQILSPGTVIRVNIPADAKVDADPFFLESIIDNLINNAVKYGKKNGTLRFDWVEHEHCLSLADDGPGISAEHLPRLFDRFYRVDPSRSSTVSGNGLGLSIVKKMTDLQKIRISVTSSEMSGTRFDLHFPV